MKANRTAVSANNILVVQKTHLTANSELAGLVGNEEIRIEESQLSLTTQGMPKKSTGLSSANGNISITETSQVDINAQWNGIYTTSSAIIENSQVNIQTEGYIGLLAKKDITISTSDVHASTQSQFPAIAVLYIKQPSDNQVIPRITMDQYSQEKMNSKIAVTQWFDSNGIMQSYTAFIALNDNQLLPDLSNAINQVIIQIKSADYTFVDQEISQIPDDLSLYTNESVKAVIDAKNAIIRNKKITEQSIVDSYASAIHKAVTQLIFKPADYTNVDRALAKIPNNLSIYTKESVLNLERAKKSIVRDKKINEQQLVDSYAIHIEIAIQQLKRKDIVIDVEESQHESSKPDQSSLKSRYPRQQPYNDVLNIRNDGIVCRKLLYISKS
ncbi:MAG: carbohydrate-binding domain-containing protein [Coprobacillus cateniformis]